MHLAAIIAIERPGICVGAIFCFRPIDPFVLKDHNLQNDAL
jgi:hypothetical protein